MKLRSSMTLGALVTWFALAAASPAFADRVPDDGEVPGDPLSTAQVLLIYVGIPAAIIAVIWLLASLPSMLRTPRYRPGVSWWAAPVWFGRPAAAAAAAEPPAEPETTGGTSARW